MEWKNMSYKIAVASSDGKVVNQHFGRAEQFYIVEVDHENRFRTVGIRKLTPACEGGTHDDGAMERNCKALDDCDYVLVSRIGNGAEQMLEHYGIRAYVIPDMIEEAIKKIIAYVEVNQMIAELTQ